MASTRREEESYVDPAATRAPEEYVARIQMCLGHYEKPGNNYHVPVLDFWVGRETIGIGKEHPYFKHLSKVLARDGQ